MIRGYVDRVTGVPSSETFFLELGILPLEIELRSNDRTQIFLALDICSGSNEMLHAATILMEGLETVRTSCGHSPHMLLTAAKPYQTSKKMYISNPPPPKFPIIIFVVSAGSRCLPYGLK